MGPFPIAPPEILREPSTPVEPLVESVPPVSVSVPPELTVRLFAPAFAATVMVCGLWIRMLVADEVGALVAVIASENVPLHRCDDCHDAAVAQLPLVKDRKQSVADVAATVITTSLLLLPPA